MSMGKILGDRRYRIGCPIAKGAFSTVYRCVDLTTGKAYAVKVVSRALVEANKMQGAVVCEINAMEVMPRSKYLVNLVDKLVSTRNYYLIMDLVEGGTLSDLIRSSPLMLSTQWCRRIFRQLLKGLSALHGSNIVHCDIKPENLLLNEEHTQLIISDFGFACYAPPGRLLHRACGTLKYCAPELLQCDPRYDGREVDVWAAGVTLYVMLFNTYPFQGDEKCPDTLVQAVMAGKYTFPRPVSPSLEHLFSVMLQPVPAKRWSVERLLRHTWVVGVDPPVAKASSRTAISLGEIVPKNHCCGHASEEFLVQSSLAKALEDDDLCGLSRRSRSCPLSSRKLSGDEVLGHTGLKGEVNGGAPKYISGIGNKRGRKGNANISTRASDASGEGEKCTELGGGGGGLSTDLDVVSNDTYNDNNSHIFRTMSFVINSSGGSPTSLSTSSKVSRDGSPVSYTRDFILTLKAIVNFFLFCTALVVIGGMRLLLDVDFNDLPIPSFLRAMVERLIKPPEDVISQHLDPQRNRNQTRGERLRQLFASAERAISASNPRRRVVPT
ncbi:Small Surface Antigen [Trypanosoma cruzi]|uniref:Protein lipid droplet kinase (LDK) n=1 Tax=Trypanosoma cruzi TaxID=5693 RepID=A0A7J6XU32_TRYCR|nr:protein lipid droplet kinase (LDK) [Trypanosoma cruzi]KAF8275685.1 Small Surface Antigen [Trypanosoma cruzi]